jgi:hypothetical protein
MQDRGWKRMLIVLIPAGLGVVLSCACLALILSRFMPRADGPDLFGLLELPLPTPAATIGLPLPTLAVTSALPAATRTARPGPPSPQSEKPDTPAPPNWPTATALPAPIGTTTLVDPTLKDLKEELANVTPGQVIEIHMSEAALDGEIRSYLETTQTPNYRYKSLKLKDGLLTVYGQVQIESMLADAEVTVSPRVADCWFDVDVKQVKLGRFPAPGFLADQLAKVIQQWTQSYGADAPVCIQELTITDDGVTFVGVMQ